MENSKLQLTKLEITDFIIDDGILWFTSNYYNFLFGLNISNWTVEEIYRIPLGRVFDRYTIVAMYQNGDEIIMIPREHIGGIFVFSKKDRCIFFRNCNLPLERWGRGSTQDIEYFYMPIKNKNQILQIKKADNSYEYIDIPKEISGINAINKISDVMWAVEVNDDNVVKWNMVTNEIVLYDGKPENHKKFAGGDAVCGIVGEHRQAIFPRYLNSIMLLEEGEQLVDSKVYFDDFNFSKALFNCVHKIDENIFAYMNGYDCWRIYDSKLELKKEIQMKYSDDVANIILTENIIYNYYKGSVDSYFEEEKEHGHTLRRFISSLISNERI